MSRPTCHPGTSQDSNGYPGILSNLACHLGTSQDSNGYPGILSIHGLRCLAQPTIWGHLRVVMGILGYQVFKDWSV